MMHHFIFDKLIHQTKHLINKFRDYKHDFV
jgi:hypothetical protein